MNPVPQLMRQMLTGFYNEGQSWKGLILKGNTLHSTFAPRFSAMPKGNMTTLIK